jgi:hypothetical protein
MPATQIVPILPCRDVDEVAAFYAHLGFVVTFRQIRPYACLAIRRGDIDLQFAGIDGFVPANSYGSCIIAVDDADTLHSSFAEGMRAAYGKVPADGIPRFTRPRKRDGKVRGFSIVDPGGNWIRVTARGGMDEEERQSPLLRAVEAALKVADGKGDRVQAAAVLDRALAKSPDAPVVERATALLYRAELAATLGDREGARSILDTAEQMNLGPGERDALRAEFERARGLAADAS